MTNPCIPSTQPDCSSDERGAKTYKTTQKQRDSAKLWKLRNPEKAKEVQKRAEAKRAGKRKEEKRNRYLAKRDEILAKDKAYYDTNREKKIAYQKSDARKEYGRQYMARKRESHPEKVKAAKLAAHKKRLANDPMYKLSCYHRSRLWAVMRGRPKPGPVVAAWGCSCSEMKCWIESQLQHGWTWANYGKVWVVDHFFPLAWADLGSPAEFAAVWNYRNLRPLGEPENEAKGDSVCAQAQVLFSRLVAELST